MPPALLLTGVGLLAFGGWAGARAGWGTPVPLLGFPAGLLLLLLGGVMRFATTRIELDGDALTSRDGCLGFGVTRRYRAADVARFEIQVGASRTNGGPVKRMPNVATLVGFGPDRPAAGNKPTEAKRSDATLAWGYPDVWLRALAASVADALPAAVTVTEPAGVGAVFGRDVGDPPAASAEKVPPQPEGSRVLVERGADHLNFLVDGGTDHGLTAIAIGAGTLAVVVAMVSAAKLAGGPTGDLWTALGVSIGVAGLCVGLGVVGRRMRNTQTILDLTGRGPGGTVSLRTSNRPGHERVRTWATAELAAVRRDRSNVTVNDRPVLHLELHPVAGQRVGVFRSLTPDELAWLAAEVRAWTGLPKTATGGGGKAEALRERRLAARTYRRA